jgi:predicted transcriptional regulator
MPIGLFVGCPITNFLIILKILDVLDSVKDHILSVDAITSNLNKSKTVIRNALPIMREMGLIRQTSQGIALTEHGLTFVSYQKNNDNEKIREFAKNIILKNSKILQLAFDIIEKNPTISIDELGNELNDMRNPDKKWVNDLTCRNVGRTCMSILGGLQLISTNYNVRRIGYSNLRKDTIFPRFTSNTLFSLINEFKEDNTWYIFEPGQTSGQRTRRQAFAASLIDLGIAEYLKDKNDTLVLTANGIKLKNTVDEKTRIKVFQDILLENDSIRDILKTIYNKYKNVGYKELGNIIAECDEAQWSEVTKNSYSVKLLSWLKYAEILENNFEWGKYHLTQSFLEKHKELFSSIKKATITDSYTFNISVTDTQKIIGNLHRNFNNILHSENNEWYDNIDMKEKIISYIEELIDFYKSNNKSIRALIHLKHFVEAGYELNRIQYIENCVQILVDKFEKAGGAT